MSSGWSSLPLIQQKMVSNIGVILETRIGLKTIKRKKNTACGVKLIGKVQWNFKAYYLYRAIAPQTGEGFWLEFSHRDVYVFK